MIIILSKEVEENLCSLASNAEVSVEKYLEHLIGAALPAITDTSPRLRDISISNRLYNRLPFLFDEERFWEPGHSWNMRYNKATVKDLARAGRAAIQKIHGAGHAAMAEAVRICDKYGYEMTE